MLVSTTMMTVGGTRLTNCSGSSCAEAVAVHHIVMPRQTSAPARRRAAGIKRLRLEIAAIYCTPMLPVPVFMCIFVSPLPGVWTAALRAR